MRSTRTALFALFLAGPAILLVCALAFIAASLFGTDPVWRQTEFDLKGAVEARNRVAVKVFAERGENVDVLVSYAGPEIGRSEPVALAPLVIAVLREYEDIVRVLLESGSNPAAAFSRMPPDVAAALRRYAARNPGSMLGEFLIKYNPGPELR
jgi:hypothetical protein